MAYRACVFMIGVPPSASFIGGGFCPDSRESHGINARCSLSTIYTVLASASTSLMASR